MKTEAIRAVKLETWVYKSPSLTHSSQRERSLQFFGQSLSPNYIRSSQPVNNTQLKTTTADLSKPCNRFRGAYSQEMGANSYSVITPPLFGVFPGLSEICYSVSRHLIKVEKKKKIPSVFKTHNPSGVISKSSVELLSLQFP